MLDITLSPTPQQSGLIWQIENTALVDHPTEALIVIIWSGKRITGTAAAPVLEREIERYMLTVKEYIRMQAVPDAAGQRDFCNVHGRSLSHSQVANPLAPAAIRGLTTSEEPKLSFEEYMAQRQISMEQMHNFGMEHGVEMLGESDIPDVNLNFQSFAECAAHAALVKEFPAKPGDDNKLGVDLDAMHRGLVLRPQPAGLLENEGDPKRDLVATTEFDLGAHSAMKITKTDTYSEMPAFDNKGNSLLARILVSKSTMMATPKKIQIFNEYFNARFVYEREYFKKTVISSISIGFNLAIALGGTATVPAHNAVGVGDNAFKLLASKTDPEDASAGTFEETGDTGSGDTGSGDKGTGDTGSGNTGKGQTPPSGGMISGGLGFSFVKQKIKARERETEKLISDNTFLKSETQVFEF